MDDQGDILAADNLFQEPEGFYKEIPKGYKHEEYTLLDGTVLPVRLLIKDVLWVSSSSLCATHPHFLSSALLYPLLLFYSLLSAQAFALSARTAIRGYTHALPQQTCSDASYTKHRAEFTRATTYGTQAAS